MADQGDATAQSTLGDIYYYGEEVEEDKYEALKWYQKAAQQGDVDSQKNLV